MIIGHHAQQDYFSHPNNIHHGLLFCGDEGVGKSHFAWEMASQFLNSDVESLKMGMHADFRYLTQAEGKNTIGIDAVRDAMQVLQFTALRKKRVVLIDPADKMTLEAANALLKFLEEPPPESYLFLVCHQEQRLLDTIRSRVLPIRFFPLVREDEEKILTHIGIDPAEMEREPALYAMTQGKPGLFARLYQQQCHIYLADCTKTLTDLSKMRHEQLQALTDELTQEQFLCFCHSVIQLFTAWASQSVQEQSSAYRIFSHISWNSYFRLWDKVQHAIAEAYAPQGLSFSHAAYFILQSLHFLSKKHV